MFLLTNLVVFIVLLWTCAEVVYLFMVRSLAQFLKVILLLLIAVITVPLTPISSISTSHGKADKVSNKIERKIIEEFDPKKLAEGDSCIACEG